MKTLQFDYNSTKYINTMASQLTDVPSNLDSEQATGLDSSVIDNLPSSSSICSKKRARTSQVWDHTPFERNAIIKNIRDRVVWHCKYCKKEYLEDGGTTIIVAHLKEHKIDISSAQAQRTVAIQSNIASAFARAEQQSDYKRRCLVPIDTEPTIKPAVLEHLYIQWITSCGIAFRMVTIPEFRA